MIFTARGVTLFTGEPNFFTPINAYFIAICFRCTLDTLKINYRSTQSSQLSNNKLIYKDIYFNLLALRVL